MSCLLHGLLQAPSDGTKIIYDYKKWLFYLNGNTNELSFEDTGINCSTMVWLRFEIFSTALIKLLSSYF